MFEKTVLLEKIKESFASVLPVTIITLLLVITICPVSAGMLLSFLAGAVLLILGMGLFSLGADMSMIPMGEYIGAQMTKSRKIWLVVFLSFMVGFMATICEPDLQVLAGYVPTVKPFVLTASVGLGVGIFLMSGGTWGLVPTIAGIGTIITAFFMGPLIQFFNTHVAEPMLKK